MSFVFAQAPNDSRDEVLHLRVAFQPRHFGDLHGAVFTDFAKVVAQ